MSELREQLAQQYRLPPRYRKSSSTGLLQQAKDLANTLPIYLQELDEE